VWLALPPTGEQSETVTNFHALKVETPDGKMRMTNVGDVEQIFRLLPIKTRFM
jgi:hypothetical protein